MAEQVPFLYFLFAPRDLAFTEGESTQLKELLKEQKDKGIIDFRPVDYATRDDIRTKLNASIEECPCWLHFSGHANSFEVKAQDGPISRDALARFLKTFNMKVLFLNGCGTEGHVAEIFKETDVQAIIATHCRVSDELAKDVSLMFYREFVIGGATLEVAYRNLFYEFRTSCATRGGVRQAETEVEEDEKLENRPGFAWGIFTRKGVSAANISLKSILSADDPELDGINDAIIKLKGELAVAEEDKEYAKDRPSLAAKVEKEIEEIKNKLRKAALVLDSKLERGHMAALRIKLRRDVALAEEAIQSLNYGAQRSLFEDVDPDKGFLGGFGFSGDPHSVMDLLYDVFKIHTGTDVVDNTWQFEYDPHTTNVLGTFWEKLAREVSCEVKGTASVEEQKRLIMDALVVNRFCYAKSEPQKNVLVRFFCSDEFQSDQEIINDFWTLLMESLGARNLLDVKRWRVKLLFICMDGKTSKSRIQNMSDARAAFKTKFEEFECFNVAKEVDEVYQEELENWLRARPLLKRFKLSASEAQVILRKKESDKMHGILTEFKKRFPFEIPLLVKYKIS